MQSKLHHPSLARANRRQPYYSSRSTCIGSTRDARTDGSSDVSAWLVTPVFTDAVTRLSGRSDPVPDEIWNEARKHYDERALAALLLSISLTNVWNRLKVATRQFAGEWAKSADTAKWAQKNASTKSAS